MLCSEVESCRMLLNIPGNDGKLYILRNVPESDRKLRKAAELDKRCRKVIKNVKILSKLHFKRERELKELGI